MRESTHEVQIYEGPSAEARLNQLGFTIEDIVTAVEASEIARRSCSLLEPSVAPGFKGWVAAFTVLAERKVREGWVKTETKGLPRIVNPETSVSLAVVTGSEATGRRDGEPTSKSPRGPQSALLVRSNQVQLRLFSLDEALTLPDEVEQMTWWLLTYAEGDTFRAEVSLPVGLGEDRRLSGWEERIIVDIPDLTLPLWEGEDEDELDLEIMVRPRR